MRLPSLPLLLATAALSVTVAFGAGAGAAALYVNHTQAKASAQWAANVWAVSAPLYELTVSTVSGDVYVEDDGLTLAECEAAEQALTAYTDETGASVVLDGSEAVECL